MRSVLLGAALFVGGKVLVMLASAAEAVQKLADCATRLLANLVTFMAEHAEDFE